MSVKEEYERTDKSGRSTEIYKRDVKYARGLLAAIREIERGEDGEQKRNN